MDDFKNRSKDFWKKKLTPEAYHVLREKGTEPAFTGKYWNNHEDGMYHCGACGVPLFSSDAKFDSGTGWPSFDRPENTKNVELRSDNSFGMQRTEVICKNCRSHLGHLFDDLPRLAAGKAGGPTQTGQRYCLNSCALDFKGKT